MFDGSATRSTGRVSTEIALIVGFCSLTVAVLGAHFSPTTGYEVSLYASTPLVTWIGLATAFSISLPVAILGTGSRDRTLALLLAGGVLATVAGLPLIRNYFFYGHGDALTHLGWARDVAVGDIAATELFYPALHAGSILVGEMLGVGLARAMLLIVFCLLVVFLLFVPLTVREIAGRNGLVVGTIAALLVLPVNHISLQYMNPHPISETILLSPLVLYLLVRYLDGEVGETQMGVSAIGGLLALSLVATVLYHSMQAANLLAVLVAIAFFQALVRRHSPNGTAIAGKRTVYAHTGFLAVVFVLWNSRFTVVTSTVEATVRSIAGLISGQASAGEVVSSRSSSLAGLGAGLGEVFAKLFVPSTLFALLTAGIVIVSLRRRTDESLTGVRLLGVGLVALGLFTLPFVAGTVSKLVFRNLGFVMVLSTILGAVGLVHLLGPDTPLYALGRPSQALLVGFFTVLVIVSTVVLFPSPYIYQANPAVSESSYQGYERAFDVRSTDVAFGGIRNGPQRYVQAVYGRYDVPDDLDSFGYYRQSGEIEGENLTRLPATVERPRYLVVTDHDRAREIEAYRSLRYSEDQFASLDDQVGVDRVLSNGAFELFHVEPETEG